MTVEETIAAAVAAQMRPELDALRAEIRSLRAELARNVPQASAVLLTVEEVGVRAGGVTAETVRAWIHSRKLIASKVEGRYLVKAADLEHFLSRTAAEKPATIDSDTHLQLVTERMNRGSR